MGKDWSIHDEIHVVSFLAWDGFGQNLLRNILYPRWYGRGFANTCLDKFCGLAGMGVFWSTHVDIHFVSSLAWEVFGQHMLSPYWHGRGLINAC